METSHTVTMHNALSTTINLSLTIVYIYPNQADALLGVSLSERYYLGSVAVRELDDIKVELKDWHPTTSGNMDSANNPDIGAVDLVIPDLPAQV